ncbi:hypothetical protein DU506_03235 [Vreelandella rituensis]|uniref:Uncharacterized protein n=1 Tax=Vreelandella rituensis TaxID=2282306 RepID=A0A368U8V6_9GAMM|nr:hypothetical protein DU506_03235 [Halomonas rituensis]
MVMSKTSWLVVNGVPVVRLDDMSGVFDNGGLRGSRQNRYYNVTPLHSAKANAFIEQEFIDDRTTDQLWRYHHRTQS